MCRRKQREKKKTRTTKSHDAEDFIANLEKRLRELIIRYELQQHNAVCILVTVGAAKLSYISPLKLVRGRSSIAEYDSIEYSCIGECFIVLLLRCVHIHACVLSTCTTVGSARFVGTTLAEE